MDNVYSELSSIIGFYYNRSIYIQYLDLDPIIRKYGQTSVIDAITTIIINKNIGFPYKHLAISEQSVTNMFTKLIRLKANWNHQPYTINDQNGSRFILPTDFAFPGEIPKPYSYLHSDEEYWNMDIIVDYFIEPSRIKSYRARSKKSPFDAWNNNDNPWYKRRAVEIVINKRIDISAHQLREALYEIPEIEECTNEKPSFIASLFRLLYPNSRPRIFDATAGWGDRLIASIAINASVYLGVDPNTENQPYLTQMISAFGNNGSYQVLPEAMPDANLPEFAQPNSFDICIISPPSFDTEIYSCNLGQSLVMYPNRNDWFVLFLCRTLQRCWLLLRPGGFLIIQSLLASEINAYVRARLISASYLGTISVRTGTGRFKPMWIWMKGGLSPHQIGTSQEALMSLNADIQARLNRNEDIQLAVTEPFPYKKEFLNPEELWRNAVNLTLTQLKVINIPNTQGWRSIPPNFKWQFNGTPIGIIVSEEAYEKVDKLVDYFSEEARMKAKRKGCVSPSDFYQSNYQQVMLKAQQLQQLNNNNLPFRHWLREAIYYLTPECTSFKISVTKTLLKYLGSKVVLDPSAGWGDRLLGAAAAGVSVYHGIDPNPLLRKSYDDMLTFIRSHGIGKDYFVLSEDFLQVNFGSNQYDTVFTSPPFFDYEIYVNDPKQSITGRSTLESWTTGFLYPYITKAWTPLASGGYFALYISDTRSGRYVNNMVNFINTTLRGNYLGIIAVTTPNLDHGYPIWIWKK